MCLQKEVSESWYARIGEKNPTFGHCSSKMSSQVRRDRLTTSGSGLDAEMKP